MAAPGYPAFSQRTVRRLFERGRCRWRRHAHLVGLLSMQAPRRACSVASAARSRPASSRPRGPSPTLAGRDTVLFLPWHEYSPAPFTDHQVMVNPAAAQGRSGPTS